MQSFNEKKQTNAGKEAYLDKTKEVRENRKEEIIHYISENPGETAYSLSKKLDIPRASMINILNELEEDMEIKYEKDIENGRLKKKIYVRSINDFTYTQFHEETLDIPVVQKLIQNTQEKDKNIIIELSNGNEKVFEPKEDIFSYFGVEN